MTETQADFNKLNQQLNWSSQRIYELEQALNRVKFEKDSQIDELTNKLWLSSNAYDQIMNKHQETQSQFEEYKKRVHFLEAENAHLHEQIRYAQASESELRNTAQHFHDKSNNLEFNLDYKNYLLSSQQDLIERDLNLRSDTEFYNTFSSLDANQQSELSLAHSMIIHSPSSEESTMDFENSFNEDLQDTLPCRFQSVGKLQRESSKLARRPQNTRYGRKLAAAKPLPLKRK